MSTFHYHPVLRAELERMAAVVFEVAPVDLDSVERWMRAQLLLAGKDTGPIEVRILGNERVEDFWDTLAIRDTIARAWDRPGPDDVYRIEIRGQIS